MSVDQLLHPLPTATELLLASTIGADHLTLVGGFDTVGDGDSVLIIDTEGARHDAVARCWHDPRGLHSIVVVPVRGVRVHTIVVGTVPLTIQSPRDGLQPVLRFGAAAADAAVRNEIMAFLLSALTHGVAMTPCVSDELHLTREALRERWSSSVIDAALPPGMQIELTIAAGRTGVYLRGWIGEPSHRLARVTAVSPEGERVDLLPRLFRFPKHDVAAFYGLCGASAAQLGVAALVTCRHETLRPDGWVVEVETADGRCFESACQPVETDSRRARELLLYELTLEPAPHTSLREHHVGPAMAAMLEASRADVYIVDEVQYGVAPKAPDVSVIVPLYRRIDFVEHQMAQFVHDPHLRASDIVYVLDSPEQADELRAQCARLHRLYRVPFRVVVLSENSGFSTANNMGVSMARGRLLLLMNSDVLPTTTGWLGDLVAFHDRIENVGCVGPKLLYEDDSIQHAGMYFERSAGQANWVNEHHFKGMHRSFAPACVDRPVAAITGACLLMDAGLYRSVGGLLGSFVQGDYEDSDLCLRLRQLGLENWYCASTELYHLEGQSYPSPMRILNHDFNTWLHTSLWNDTITTIATTSEVH